MDSQIRYLEQLDAAETAESFVSAQPPSFFRFWRSLGTIPLQKQTAPTKTSFQVTRNPRPRPSSFPKHWERTTYNAGVEGSFTSLPFGDGEAATGTDGDANHFAMLDYDAETNTGHAQFRQYSNTQGHWLQSDPYGGSYKIRNPQSFNRYVYSANRPLSATDPLGLDDTDVDPCHDPSIVCYANDDGSGTGGGDGSGDNQLTVDTDPVQSPDGNSSVPTYQLYSDPPPLATYQLFGWANSTLPLVLSPDSATGPGPVALVAPNNVAHTAVAGSVAIPVIPAVVVDIPFAVIPSTHKVCLGIGGGVGSPGINAGLVHSSQNIQNVLSGASVSFAAQAGWWGVQTIQNNSGLAVGNSMGSPGASLTVTYSWCF
jgi:RHS repeat-associated protein